MAEYHELLFVRPPLTESPYQLIFGEGDEVPGSVARAYIDTPKLSPVPQFQARNGPQVTIEVTMAKPVPEVTCDVDLAVSRGLRASAGIPFQSGTKLNRAVTAPHQDGISLKKGAAAVWQDGTRLKKGSDIPYREMTRLKVGKSARFQDGTRLKTSATAPFQEMTRTPRPVLNARWQEGTTLKASAKTVFQDMTHRPRPILKTRWQVGTPLEKKLETPSGVGSPTYMRTSAYWGLGRALSPGIRTPVIPPGPEPCYTPPSAVNVELVFVEPRQAEGDNTLTFRCYVTDGTDPPPDGLVIIPVRNVYMSINDVFARRVGTGQVIPLSTLNLSLDVNTWTYGFSASMSSQYKDRLDRTSPEVPVILALSINGEEYYVNVERLGRSRTFPKTTLSIQGKGLSSILDNPYSPVQTWDNVGALRTAAQLMDDVLTFNETPIGWSVDFQMEDWDVLAGAWNFTGTYMKGLQQIAQAAGGIIQPHPTDQVVRVLKRFPEVPWNWAGVTPDFELPSAGVIAEDTRWEDKPKYTGVLVRGTSMGVSRLVKITGEDGAYQAPMVADALITSEVAARNRGAAVLSERGTQIIYTLNAPVFPESGIIHPNKFVQYNNGIENKLGLVQAMSTTFDASSGKLRQRLEILSYA